MLDPKKPLTNKRVAIVVTDGFEESELFEPKRALEDAGAYVDVISPKDGRVRAWFNGDWGKPIEPDKTISEVSSADYDALMLPGGVINSDKLRMNKEVIEFVTCFVESGKPVAAICHALWLLIETGHAKNHILTSWPSLKTDLRNAGAQWADAEVISDHGWVTSRKPEDLPAFNKRMIEEFKEGIHLTPSATA